MICKKCNKTKCKCKRFPQLTGCDANKSPYFIKVCRINDRPIGNFPRILPTTEDDGIDILVTDWGSGEKGTILFVPGTGETSDVWTYNMETLADLGFRVLSIDPRGQGGSNKPFNDSSSFNVAADDIHQILEAINLDNITLVGRLFGAGSVLRYAARYKSDRICKLVTVDIGRVSLSQPPPIIPLPVRIAALRNDFPGVLRNVADNLYFSQPQSQATKDWIWNMFLTTSLPTYIQKLTEGDSAGTLDGSEELLDDGKKVTVPTLIIHGANDLILPPANSILLATVVPDNTLEIVPNAGHGVQICQKQVFNNLISNFACGPNNTCC